MEKHFVQKYQDGEITLQEFQRLDALHVIESAGYKIFAPESVEYLKGLLVAAAPLPPFDQKVAEMMAGIEAQRDEVAKAFLATYACEPADVEQYSGPDPDNGMGIVWGLRMKRRPATGTTAKRPTIGIERAGMILEEIDSRIGKIPGEATAPLSRIRTLLSEFRDRWFAFHEQTLQAIEDALPDSVEELGGDLPTAVATLAKRMDLAEREANKLKDEIQSKEDERIEKMGEQAQNGTHGHIGDLSQIISDLDLYQEEIDKLAGKHAGKVPTSLTEELRLYADLLRSACANLEPLRNRNPDGSIPRGDATLIGRINEVVQEWKKSRPGDGRPAPEMLDKISGLINQFGAEILAQAHAQDLAASAPKFTIKVTGYNEDPHLLVRDILIRIIYSGHPRETKTADGRPDWSAIIARINDFLHPKTGGGISTIENMRKILEKVQEQWEPVIALCQRNGDALGMRVGEDICERVLQIVQEYIEAHEREEARAERARADAAIAVQAAGMVDPPPPIPFGENGTCLTCGLSEHEHWLTDGHEFRGKANG